MVRTWHGDEQWRSGKLEWLISRNHCCIVVSCHVWWVSVDVVRYLVSVCRDAAAIINLPTTATGRTCLHIAVLTNNVQLLHYLLDSLAHCNVTMRFKVCNIPLSRTSFTCQSINQSFFRWPGLAELLFSTPVNVQQVVRKRLTEQVCLEEVTKCGQWFCWCHVFREVIPSLRAGDRKSSAANSRQSADRQTRRLGRSATRAQGPKYPITGIVICVICLPTLIHWPRVEGNIAFVLFVCLYLSVRSIILEPFNQYIIVKLRTSCWGRHKLKWIPKWLRSDVRCTLI